MALSTLWDSPQLAPLAQAAEKAGVELELFGSVATRALLFDAAKVQPRSLFDLAEHIADIDLAHSGPPERTATLEREIARVFPLAPWFRWSIIDCEQAARRDALRQFNIRVPLRELSLGTRPTKNEAERRELLTRALEGEITLLDSDSFDRSPRAGFDTEGSAALLYLDAVHDVFDAQLRAGREAGVRVDTGPANVLDQGLDRLERLGLAERQAAMRRLWYRLAGTAVRVPPNVFRDAITIFRLERLLDTLRKQGFPVEALRQPEGRPTFISAFVGKNGFRIPLDASPTVDYRAGNDLLEELLLVRREWTTERLKLAEGNRIVAAVMGVPLTSGDSQSSPSFGGLCNDFVHIALPLSTDRSLLDEERLTAVVIGTNKEGPVLVPAFASVSLSLRLMESERGGRAPVDRCTIRINLAAAHADTAEIHAFLMEGEWQ